VQINPAATVTSREGSIWADPDFAATVAAVCAVPVTPTVVAVEACVLAINTQTAQSVKKNLRDDVIFIDSSLVVK
jgi:hypothetical protein